MKCCLCILIILVTLLVLTLSSSVVVFSVGLAQVGRNCTTWNCLYQTVGQSCNITKLGGESASCMQSGACPLEGDATCYSSPSACPAQSCISQLHDYFVKIGGTIGAVSLLALILAIICLVRVAKCICC
jgi:hypothetical protein